MHTWSEYSILSPISLVSITEKHQKNHSCEFDIPLLGRNLLDDASTRGFPHARFHCVPGCSCDLDCNLTITRSDRMLKGLPLGRFVSLTNHLLRTGLPILPFSKSFDIFVPCLGVIFRRNELTARISGFLQIDYYKLIARKHL